MCTQRVARNLLWILFLCLQSSHKASRAPIGRHEHLWVHTHTHTHTHVMEKHAQIFVWVCPVYTHLLAHLHTHTHQQMIDWGEIYLRSSGPPIEGWHGDISCCDLISCLLVWVPAGVRGGCSGTQEVTLAKSLKFSTTWQNLAPGRALTSLTWRLKSTLKIK